MISQRKYRTTVPNTVDISCGTETAVAMQGDNRSPDAKCESDGSQRAYLSFLDPATGNSVRRAASRNVFKWLLR